MNEVLLDQIPALAAMLRSLEHLSMTNVPSQLASNPFMVQQVPMFLAQIEKNVNWKDLAAEHQEKLKQTLDQSEREHMQRLADLYSNNNVEGLVEGFKCGKCQKEAFKRCSKCKSIWYCSRECQVADWTGHKAKCAEKAKELKEQEEKQRKGLEIK